MKRMETEMDQLRERHLKSPEMTLLHQVAELKGRLADGERRIEAIRAEKAQVTAEKEEFRSNVHKLVSRSCASPQRPLRHRGSASKPLLFARSQRRPFRRAPSAGSDRTPWPAETVTNNRSASSTTSSTRRSCSAAVKTWCARSSRT